MNGRESDRISRRSRGDVGLLVEVADMFSDSIELVVCGSVEGMVGSDGMELVVLIRLALRSRWWIHECSNPWNRSLFSVFQVPSDKQESVFRILSISLLADLGRMEAGRCVVKRVVIETRDVPPDDCATQSESPRG